MGEKILFGCLGTLLAASVLALLAGVGFLIHNATLDPWGIVTAKNYRPAHFQPGYMAGKVHVPGQYYPESWSITLENGKLIPLNEWTWKDVKAGDYWGTPEAGGE